MSRFFQDLRFALRMLARSPVFSGVAILSLALGVGVNTALFSFVDRLLLRSLPVRDPELLTLLDSPGAHLGRVEGDQSFTYPAYQAIRDRNDVFSGVLARFHASVSLSWKNSTDLAQAELVSGNYFDVLGLEPYAGRLLTQEDDRVQGAHPIAVLSHGYWNRRFGGQTRVIGEKILINSHPYEIVGVAPPGFHGILVGRDIDVFVPMMMKAQITPTLNGLDDRRHWFANVFARLKPGITMEQAEARLAPVYQRILEEDLAQMPAGIPQRFVKMYGSKKLLLQPGYRGKSEIRGSMATPSLVLMAMVALVLLIACANLANLLLARAAGRQKEIAIRLSLGASRVRLVRQLFTESAVLAVAGGALGLLVAVWAGDLLVSFAGGGEEARAMGQWSLPDARVLAFNFGIAIATAGFFGLIPAWKATRPVVADTLKDQAGSVSSTIGDVRLRKGLVVAQIALSLLLLIGATLFARSLSNLRGLDPGFNPDRILTFSIDPSLSGYQGQRALDLLERLRANISSLPGVTAVAATDNAVLANNVAIVTMNIEGYQPREGVDMNPDMASVSPGFFQSMGVKLIAGRDFNEGDRRETQPVTIVNEAFAKKYFPKENPLGRRIGTGRDKPEIVIVGVVGGMRYRNLRDENRAMYYLPYLRHQQPGQFTFYVRTAANPSALGAAVRREVQKLAANMPVFEMRTMESQFDYILAVERAVATMSGFFGLLATLLAAVGLYGVMAYTVTRRTREIGIRVALGAERSSVLWLVLREVTLMALIGIGIGLPIAIGLSRYVETQLYGLTPNDPLTFVAAAVILAGIAVAAGLIPANRAARVDPIRALRYE